MATRVTEDYRNWEPPISGASTVEHLLQHVPQFHLAGLREVVLTNSGSLARGRRRARTWVRGRKVPVDEVRGLYHPSGSDQPPWIELFVDRICAGLPRWVFRVRLFREWFFAEVLFHEVGHHIHATTHREHADRESVAEQWRQALSAAYLRRRYWYLRPFARAYASLRQWAR